MKYDKQEYSSFSNDTDAATRIRQLEKELSELRLASEILKILWQSFLFIFLYTKMKILYCQTYNFVVYYIWLVKANHIFCVLVSHR